MRPPFGLDFLKHVVEVLKHPEIVLRFYNYVPNSNYFLQKRRFAAMMIKGIAAKLKIIAVPGSGTAITNGCPPVADPDEASNIRFESN
jgi:hypothetical protein